MLDSCGALAAGLASLGPAATAGLILTTVMDARSFYFALALASGLLHRLGP